MRPLRLISWCVGMIASVCCVAVLTGCLDVEKTVLLIYDAKTDTFSYLVVYQQIRGLTNSLPFHTTTAPATAPAPATSPFAAQPGDDGLADLQALVRQRRDLIFFPFPKWILCDMGLVKQPNGRAVACFLTELTAPMNTLKKSIAVGAVRTIPGTFFRRGKDNLCYYQAEVLPGGVIDQLIDLINKSDAQSTQWQEAIDARKSAKGPLMTWPEYGKRLADFIQSYDGGDHSDYPGDPQSLQISVGSLQMLRDQAQQHQFRLQRNGAAIFMDVKLTPEDVDGAMQIIDMVHNSAEARLKSLADPAVQQKTKNGADGVDAIRGELAIVDAITFSKVDAHTLRVNFDLVRFCTDGTLRPIDPLPAVAEDFRGTDFSDKDVPIDSHVTVEQLSADFLAGKLTAGQ